LKDKTNTISMSLKQSVKIRDYQAKALERMFSNSRARSGVIVLPCGSGKTLVGITAAVTMKKSCLCLVTGGVSAEQWRSQFIFFSTVNPKHVCRFTGKVKDPLPKDGSPVILITTYTMLTFGSSSTTARKRSKENQMYMNDIRARTWGLLLCDEVHVAPAATFRNIANIVKCHTKLGLTATLVREDGKIGEISYLIGPKLYEANWMDLTKRGYLAKVLCSEVWCPMTTEFYREYLNPLLTARTKTKTTTSVRG
jgi:DNA excision repair protein ERCC-3